MENFTTHTHRWSQVIPPHTALTFAVVWDPDEGMLTFDGGKLLESDICDARSTPRDVLDGQSQVLTLDRLTLPLPSGTFLSYDGEGKRTRAPTVTFACDHALDDTHSVVDPYLRMRMQQAAAGNGGHGAGDGAAESEDSVYSQESAIYSYMAHRTDRNEGQKRNGTVQSNRLQLQAIGRQLYSVVVAPFERRSGGQSSEDDSTVTDEGFFEEVPLTARTSTSAPVLVNLNLKSAFSVTTASTSAFVRVETPPTPPPEDPSTLNSSPCRHGSSPSEAWSALEGVEGCTPNIRQSRRLRKTRPSPPKSPCFPLPADPAEVLARTEYNHTIPSPHSESAISFGSTTLVSAQPGQRTLKHQKSMAKVVKSTVDRLTRCTGKKSCNLGDEMWVCVNVSHKVTQYVCALDLQP